MLEMEKGQTNKDVAQLFGVPANTLSTWKKNEDGYLSQSLEFEL